MPSTRTTPTQLGLADLIDLEMQLAADRDLDLAELRARDGEIGAAIGAQRLEGPALLAAWLDAVRRRRPGGGESIGQKASRYLELLAFLLLIGGGLLGIAAVLPWLGYQNDRPVNVILFWSSLVGVQIVLLVLLLIALLPSAWLARLPGAGAVQSILRSVGRIPPAVGSWLGTRLSTEFRTVWAALRGEARRLDWLYGRLHFWLLVRLTQLFAVAFNLGALVTFVGFSYGNDPAFGWKSTRLDASGLQRAVDLIALPWSGWLPSGPDREQIAETYYESLRPETFPSPLEGACWWPFLLASLITYGLAPRLLTCLVAHRRVRRTLKSARLDHYEIEKLIERLRRRWLISEGSPEDAKPRGATDPAAGPAPDESYLALGEQPLTVLRWSGVDLSSEGIAELLSDRLGAGVNAVLDVGGLEASNDDRALEEIRDAESTGPVAVVVESWEPPVGDYIDFLEKLRVALRSGRTIVVVLYHRDRDGRPLPPTDADAEIWRRRLAEVGDPWLRVTSLCPSTAAAGPTSGPGREADG